jgi:hypothetical protein
MHIVGFVLLGGFLLAFFGLNRDRELPIDAVVVSGSDGNPNGVGNDNPGNGVPPTSEAIDDKDKSQQATISNNLNKESLVKPEAKKLDLPVAPDSVRRVEADTSADTRLGAISEKLRAKISGTVAVQEKGGSGRGGPGRGNITQREKRQLRWTMIFNTRNGEDYANQLIGLGAILAIPGANNEYLVIRDLDRRHGPVQAKPEDLKDLNRIYWVDDKPESVHSLAMALGIHPVPHHIVAFFPQDLEKELLDKELKAFRGKEEDIAETVFSVDHRSGRYEPVVQRQTPR